MRIANFEFRTKQKNKHFFSALCQVKRKTAMPSAREIDLIKRFLAENLGEDDSTFRQNFVSDFTVLVVRLRDNTLSAFRKELKKSGQGSNAVGNIWNREGSQLINEVTDLHDIMTILFDNLYGGANYQRLISALELLTTFHFGMFEYEAHRGMNKRSGNGRQAK